MEVRKLQVYAVDCGSSWKACMRRDGDKETRVGQFPYFDEGRLMRGNYKQNQFSVFIYPTEREAR